MAVFSIFPKFPENGRFSAWQLPTSCYSDLLIPGSYKHIESATAPFIFDFLQCLIAEYSNTPIF